MPGQQRARCHEPLDSQATRQPPGHGSEHGTVRPVRPRAGDLAPQDRDLMPEDQDLDVHDGITARQQYQQPNTRTMNR